ncbi:MAG: polysaccharide deacetylase family protein [Rhodospirillales bacterium]|jgi:peptidoglycan/xylan/chitin deacetylase (PgdA/CDA1 family)|nr:polysaccharide deacetylase family protein [Rhodospirillales bacterium]
MKLPRERVDYSAMIDREPPILPDGARMIFWTIVNVEEWDMRYPMARTVLPPPGGGSHLPDVPNWAWHEYGMRVGFWRFFDLFKRFGIQPTLSINGSVCQSYPRVAGAAHEAGWEFMGHGFIQRPAHLVEDQRDMIAKTVEAIRAFTGKAPRGWLGPGLTETWESVDLLAEAGFEYVADWVMDEHPFEIKTDFGPIVSLPYSVELNDIPMMTVQHHQSQVLEQRVMDHFERLYEESATMPRIMALAIHPYVSGVPHRIKYVERIYEQIAKKPGVLFWRGDQILDWYKQSKAA